MNTPKKEFLMQQLLRKKDSVELPMDDLFFEKMHDNIMQAVEKMEIKTEPKWSQAKVFLEPKSNRSSM